MSISTECVLDISHLGLVSQLIRDAGVPGDVQSDVFKAIGEKNLHELDAICRGAGVSEERIRLLQSVFSLSGSLRQVLPALRKFLAGDMFCRFDRILSVLLNTPQADMLRIDFSVVDNIHYYNGFVFKGFISGVPTGVLSGGQYDKLMKKMHRACGAIGFAVYTDMLERLGDTPDGFDVDTVLLYPQSAPAAVVFQKTEELTAQGLHVLALSCLPEQLRYRNLVRLEVTDLAENT